MRSYRYDFDIENVRIYVYCKVMTANGALHQKHEAEIGTYETYTYKCVAYRVFCVFGVDVFNKRSDLLMSA